MAKSGGLHQYTWHATNTVYDIATTIYLHPNPPMDSQHTCMCTHTYTHTHNLSTLMCFVACPCLKRSTAELQQHEHCPITNPWFCSVHFFNHGACNYNLNVHHLALVSVSGSLEWNNVRLEITTTMFTWLLSICKCLILYNQSAVTNYTQWLVIIQKK